MNVQPDYSDRRRHARFELFDYAVLERLDAPETHQCVVIDVSLGGIQVRSREELPMGVRYRLTIGRGEIKPVLITAEVRYVGPIPDTDLFSIGFRCAPQTALERIAWVEYVHDVFKSQGEILIG